MEAAPGATVSAFPSLSLRIRSTRLTTGTTLALQFCGESDSSPGFSTAFLLQVLDDGRLTDGQGRTVDFRNTVLIMTSSVRSEEAMRDTFRPEFLNRIDEIVEFAPLTREQLAERGLSLELTDAAKEHLAEAGWDPTYGARPLKRALQRLVENSLARRLLEGEFGEGETVRVDAVDGELVFEKAAATEPAAALGKI